MNKIKFLINLSNEEIEDFIGYEDTEESLDWICAACTILSARTQIPHCTYIIESHKRMIYSSIIESHKKMIYPFY